MLESLATGIFWLIVTGIPTLVIFGYGFGPRTESSPVRPELAASSVANPTGVFDVKDTEDFDFRSMSKKSALNANYPLLSVSQELFNESFLVLPPYTPSNDANFDMRAAKQVEAFARCKSKGSAKCRMGTSHGSIVQKRQMYGAKPLLQDAVLDSSARKADKPTALQPQGKSGKAPAFAPVDDPVLEALSSVEKDDLTPVFEKSAPVLHIAPKLLPKTKSREIPDEKTKSHGKSHAHTFKNPVLLLDYSPAQLNAHRGVLPMRNGSNFCYTNAALQLLIAARPFACMFVPDMAFCRDSMAAGWPNEHGSGTAVETLVGHVVRWAYDLDARGVQLERQQSQLDAYVAVVGDAEAKQAVEMDNPEIEYDDQDMVLHKFSGDADFDVEALNRVAAEEVADRKRYLDKAVRAVELRKATVPHFFSGSAYNDQQDIHEYMTKIVDGMGESVQRLFNMVKQTETAETRAWRLFGGKTLARKVTIGIHNVVLPSARFESAVRSGDAAGAQRWEPYIGRPVAVDVLLNEEMHSSQHGPDTGEGMKTTVTRAPRILAMYVNRNAFDRETGMPYLVGDDVEIPLTLSLRTGDGANFAAGEHAGCERYRLVGVAARPGRETNSGHYYALTVNPVDGALYVYNDAAVNKHAEAGDYATMERVLALPQVSSAAVLIMYERVT